MRKNTKEILLILDKTYPDAECELKHSSPFQLLVSTVLSAQTTDVQVNKVMEKMYLEYPTCESFLTLNLGELENKIKQIGLYKTKAKNVYNLVRILMEKYNGEVPNTMEELVKLPGVGRKTANVVLSNAFDVPAIAVDTHVFRLANRIGITNEKDVEHTELALMKAIDKKLWSKSHHLLIFHGRRCCTARNPKCSICPISSYCKYYKEELKVMEKLKKQREKEALKKEKEALKKKEKLIKNKLIKEKID